MGLFNKKQKKAQQQDFNILSGAGLVDFVKSNLKNPTDKNVAKAIKAIAEPDKDQKHLTKDGELPWGWLSRNIPICQPYEDKIVQAAEGLKGTIGSDRIARLKSLISYYYEYRDFCYSKDECYIKHFSDRWEHCHNSRCNDFIYITRFEEELKELEANLNSVLQEAQRRTFIERNIKPNLRDNLLQIIISKPGILQVDLCKYFPADIKSDISDELYAMLQDGLISKEKEGRLNKYFIKRT